MITGSLHLQYIIGINIFTIKDISSCFPAPTNQKVCWEKGLLVVGKPAQRGITATKWTGVTTRLISLLMLHSGAAAESSVTLVIHLADSLTVAQPLALKKIFTS